MKLASFLVVSAALHALAFFCPVTFTDSGREQITPVTILRFEEVDQRRRQGTLETKATRPGHLKAIERANPLPQTNLRNSRAGPSMRANKAFRLASAWDNFQAQGRKLPEQGNAALANPDGSVYQTTQVEISTVDTEENGVAGSPSSQSSGAARRALPESDGNGSGFGHAPNVKTDLQLVDKRDKTNDSVVLTAPAYNFTPKPDYPELARRAGKEGRVLVRVLVDEEGKSKTIEVHGSSGSKVLDQAATDAIKRWRFIPARYGERPVKSWVKIPIDFRLSE